MFSLLLNYLTYNGENGSGSMSLPVTPPLPTGGEFDFRPMD